MIMWYLYVVSKINKYIFEDWLHENLWSVLQTHKFDDTVAHFSLLLENRQVKKVED